MGPSLRMVWEENPMVNGQRTRVGVLWL